MNYYFNAPWDHECRVSIDITYTDNDSLYCTTFLHPDTVANSIEEFGEPGESTIDNFLDKDDEGNLHYSTSTNNTDLVIHHFRAHHQQKTETLELELEGGVLPEMLFWTIHDMYHAKLDFYGCIFECQAETERVRYFDALHFMIKNNLPLPSWEFFENLSEAYNTRTWGCDWRNKREALWSEEFTQLAYPEEYELEED